MRYLITGAQGFLGRHLAALLLRDDPAAEVLGIGRSPELGTFTHSVTLGPYSVPAPLPCEIDSLRRDRRVRYLQLPVHRTPAFSLSRERCPEVVFHLAAALRGDSTPSLVASNVHATTALLEAVAALRERPRVVVVASTCAVYGDADGIPIPEDATCRPLDPYAATKLEAERGALELGRRRGIRIVVARLSNLVGPGQSERHVCGRLAAQAAAIGAGLAPALLAVGRRDTTRDFLDVRDAAAALLHLARTDAPEAVYNVGSGVERSVEHLLDNILAAAGLTRGVRIDEARDVPAGVRRHCLATDRLRSLGFVPQLALADSVRDLLGYYWGPVREAVAGMARGGLVSRPAL